MSISSISGAGERNRRRHPTGRGFAEARMHPPSAKAPRMEFVGARARGSWRDAEVVDGVHWGSRSISRPSRTTAGQGRGERLIAVVVLTTPPFDWRSRISEAPGSRGWVGRRTRRRTASRWWHSKRLGGQCPRPRWEAVNSLSSLVVKKANSGIVPVSIGPKQQLYEREQARAVRHRLLGGRLPLLFYR